MLAAHYPQIFLVHVSCVALSGLLFMFRGMLRLGNIALANHRVLRLLSYTIDTILLGAAILLTLVVHQYPFVNAWLTTKVLLLVVYIVLGVAALRRARTTLGRGIAFFAALATYVFIVGVAVAHHPAGWLLLLRQ